MAGEGSWAAGRGGREETTWRSIPVSMWLVTPIYKLGGGFKNIFYFHPHLEKISNLAYIFEMGWNHQPVSHLTGGPTTRSLGDLLILILGVNI